MIPEGMPYFMTNKEWYKENPAWDFDKIGEIEPYILTEKAPAEAVESYRKYCKDFNKPKFNGDGILIS